MKQIQNYNDFYKFLGDCLYRTTHSYINSPYTNAVHYEHMFKKLSKIEAQELLDLAVKFEEFHPDRVNQYQKIIDQK